jgi:hypothetical protein
MSFDTSISPLSNEWTPFIPRMTQRALAYYDSAYPGFCCYNFGPDDSPNSNQDQKTSLITLHKTFSFANYRWVGKFTPPQKNVVNFAGFEFKHGQSQYGSAFFSQSGSGYYFQCGAKGNMTVITLPRQTWTGDTTFEIDWSRTQIIAKINGLVIATVVMNVPQESMMFFIETAVSPTASAPAQTAVWLKNKSLTTI